MHFLLQTRIQEARKVSMHAFIAEDELVRVTQSGHEAATAEPIDRGEGRREEEVTETCFHIVLPIPLTSSSVCRRKRPPLSWPRLLGDHVVTTAQEYTRSMEHHRIVTTHGVSIPAIVTS